MAVRVADLSSIFSLSKGQNSHLIDLLKTNYVYHMKLSRFSDPYNQRGFRDPPINLPGSTDEEVIYLPRWHNCCIMPLELSCATIMSLPMGIMPIP